MGVVDWRAWTDQNGGNMPSAPNPPGTPWLNAATTGAQMFPGVLPIGDLISGVTSVPQTPSLAHPDPLNTPATVNAVDPFYVGTYATGGGWVNNMERYIVPAPGTSGTQTVACWPAGSPGASVPAGPIIRPVVPGVTS